MTTLMKPNNKYTHEHQWESIILSYWNKYYSFSDEKGWIGDTEECSGSRCKICGELKRGFLKGSPEYKALFSGAYIHSNTIYKCNKFKDLERVYVKDIQNLNK